GLRQGEQRSAAVVSGGTLADRGQVMPHHNAALTIDLGPWEHHTRRADPPGRSWCKSPIWKSIRRHRLAAEPLCRQCAIEGRTVAASHVDHVNPHHDQWLLFFKYERILKACARTTTTRIGNERSGTTSPINGQSC